VVVLLIDGRSPHDPDGRCQSIDIRKRERASVSSTKKRTRDRIGPSGEIGNWAKDDGVFHEVKF
jgi:hypothetical protein